MSEPAALLEDAFSSPPSPSELTWVTLLGVWSAVQVREHLSGMPLLESKGHIFTLLVPKVRAALPEGRAASLPRALLQAEGPVLVPLAGGGSEHKMAGLQDAGVGESGKEAPSLALSRTGFEPWLCLPPAVWTGCCVGWTSHLAFPMEMLRRVRWGCR